MKKFRGFDARKLKGFFLLNVEKIVFGVTMLLVALLVYGALSQQPYNKTPDDLGQAITKAQTNIQLATTVPPIDQLTEKPRFVEVAKRSQDTVPVDDFLYKGPFYKTDLEVGTRRGEPAYLAVRDLEVSQGVGPFALKDPDPAKKFVLQAQTNVANQGEEVGAMPGRPGERTPNGAPGGKKPTGRQQRGAGGGLLGTLGGGGPDGGVIAGGGMPGGGEGMPGGGIAAGTGMAGPRGVSAPPESIVEGVRWICVTGLIPYREQRELYQKEFSTSQFTVASIDPSKDEPYWWSYLVERSEVTDANLKDPSKAKWEKISVTAARDFVKTWPVRAGDVVDPAFIDENLTFPLGPLLERNWGKEVTHSKIPMLDFAQRGAGGGGAPVEEPQTIADVGSRTDLSDLEDIRKRRQRTTQTGAMQGPGQPRTMAPRTGAVGGYSGGMPGGEDGGEGYGAAYGSAYGARSARTFTAAGEAGLEGPQEIEHLLFRFFDFTVEEGKRYRYRVQLVLENPNYGIRAQYLKDGKLGKDDLRFSPWSEPSPVGSVSGYNYLLAGKARAPEKAIEEPKVNLIAVQLDPKLGTKAVYEMRPPVSGRKERREVQSVERGQLIKFNAKVEIVHPLTRYVEEKSVDFNSNMVLLDIKGGERFSKDWKDPDVVASEVLFMDANGQLHSRSEAVDENEYLGEADWLEQLRMAKETNQQAPFGGGPDGGEGGVPGGGFPGRRGRGEGS